MTTRPSKLTQIGDLQDSWESKMTEVAGALGNLWEHRRRTGASVLDNIDTEGFFLVVLPQRDMRTSPNAS